MSQEINAKLDEMGRAWNEFKSTTEQSKKDSDALIESKLTNLDETISTLQAEIDALGKKSGRLEASEESTASQYEAKFNDWMRYGEGERELKSMATVNAENGEVVVPDAWDLNIIKALKGVSVIRSLADTIQVQSDNFAFMRSNSDMKSAWVGEKGGRPETDTPAITEVKVMFGEQYANPGVTQRSLDDGVFDVAGYVTSEITKQFAVSEGAAFIGGDGVDKPLGILATGTGIGQVNAAGAALTAEDLIDLVYSLHAEYRNGAAFIGENGTMAAIRKLTDGNGNFLWQPSFVAGQPATVLGYAAYEESNMPVIGAGATPIAFGNFKEGYLIADRQGTNIMRDPYTNKPYVHFYATKRVGGQVRDPSAIKLLKFA